jgi:hypothetical protein
MLDADALATALTMVLNPASSKTSYPTSHILDTYSDERRKVFQFFVDPTSTQNKIRAHSHPDPDQAVHDDGFLRELKRLEERPDMKRAMALMRPFFDGWRTDMHRAVEEAA